MTNPEIITVIIFALPLGFVLLLCGLARLLGVDAEVQDD